MGAFAVIFDHRFEDAPGAPSLLRAPTPRGDLLELILDRLHRCEVDTIAAAPTFEFTQAYQDELSAIAPSLRVAPAWSLAAWIAQSEAADRWLLIDARFITPYENDFADLLRAARGDAAAWHSVHAVGQKGRAREIAVADAARELTRIERVFDGVTHFPAPRVIATLASAGVLRRVSPAKPGDLGALRTALVQAGLPSRDRVVFGRSVQLTGEGLVELCEHLMADRVENGARGDDALRRPRVAGSASVHPSARLDDHVVVHERAVIGPGAVVIGPSVIGAGARVERDCVVSRAVVFPRVRIGAGQHVIGAAAVMKPGECAGPHAAVRQVAFEPRAAAPRLSLTERAIKRSADVALSLFGLLLLSPLLLLVGALVKLTSRGPLFFAHEREGLNGRPFRCLKFRTMVDRAHAQQRALYSVNNVDGPQFKMDRDPRVTWLGAWLRKTNIDELPQLINVLRGEMSIIGPRPSPFRENQLCMPWRAARLSVRPGITGLWQVCRHDRAWGDFHQWIYFDIQYVQNQSLLLDLRILIATVLTLGGRWSIKAERMIPAAAARRQRSTAAPRSASAPAAIAPAVATARPVADPAAR